MGTSLYIYVPRGTSPRKPCVSFHHNTEALKVQKKRRKGKDIQKYRYIFLCFKRIGSIGFRSKLKAQASKKARTRTADEHRGAAVGWVPMPENSYGPGPGHGSRSAELERLQWERWGGSGERSSGSSRRGEHSKPGVMNPSHKQALGVIAPGMARSKPPKSYLIAGRVTTGVYFHSEDFQSPRTLYTFYYCLRNKSSNPDRTRTQKEDKAEEAATFVFQDFCL